MGPSRNHRRRDASLPLFPGVGVGAATTLEREEATGTAYLQGIPLEQRRLSGQVYTPIHLASFILTEAGYAASADLTKKLLDPACGTGMFLLVAITRIAERLTSHGVDLGTTRGRAAFVEAVSEGVFGADIDGEACELARKNVRTLVARIAGASLPRTYFDKNVVQLDYLLDPLPHGAPLHFIVGNPPYVAATRIDKSYKERLRSSSSFKTAQGRLDLYTLFIERSVSYLAETGTLAFITPNKFLQSVTSRSLRRFLTNEGAVRKLVNFRSHRVFEDAATVPCVMVYEKAAVQDRVSLLECDDHGTKHGIQIHRASNLDPAQLHEDGTWHIVSPDLMQLASVIRGEHATVESLTKRVSAGFATGLDPLFVLPPGSDVPIEPELVRSAVRGRDLSAYRIDDPGLRMIVPYTYEGGRAKLVDIDDFPLAKSYLAREKKKLLARHCVRVWKKAWYDLHDPVPFDLATTPKILVPDVANSNQFVFDEGNHCPLHSAYYLVPTGDIDPLYFTAVLNSKPIEFLIRLSAPVAKDGFSRYRRQFMLPLPVPRLGVQTERRVSAAVRQGDHERAEQLVVRAFNLNDKQFDQINDFLSRVNLSRRS